MKIYLQTAWRSASNERELKALFERHGMSGACADMRVAVGVYTPTEFQQRARDEIHVFETWCAENMNAAGTSQYEFSSRLIKVMREAVELTLP